MTSRSSDGSGFGSKYIVFLTMMSAWLAVVVFLLGVMVGRGVSIFDIIAGQESASARGEDSLSLDEQPFVAITTRREPSMAATDGGDLSYFQRLDDDSGPELDAGLLEEAAQAPAVQDVPAIGSGEIGLPVAPAASSIPSTGYAIQVTTLRESAAAETMAQGLIEKGYPAFVVPPAPGAPVSVFRVRVGTYPDRAAAEQVLRRLEGEESFRPWITR